MLHSKSNPILWRHAPNVTGMLLMSIDILQAAKDIVRTFHSAFDSASDENLTGVLAAHTTDDYLWRGMHPFYEQNGAKAVAESFWLPLRRSLTSIQRREDVFMAGHNDVDDGETTWVASMGHMMGLFDHDWLGIPATHKMTFLRYAEFHRVENEKIVESAFFCDVISVMQQAGHYPLPPQTGASFVHPGPRTHDGILLDAQSSDESTRTMDLVNRMIADLHALNVGDDHNCPPELLAETWHEDMIWYGPTGIGATYTIPRYQEQHVPVPAAH